MSKEVAEMSSDRGASEATKCSAQGSNAAITLYLLGYNVVCLSLWMVIALLSVRYSPIWNRTAWYDKVGRLVTVAMTVALLEVVHASVKFVRSDPITTFMQVASRLHLCYVIWALLPAARTHPGTPIVILAWTCSELCRYPFYIYQLAEQLPGFEKKPVLAAALKWLRYSAFLILYPIGILGEIVVMWKAAEWFNTWRFAHWPVPMPNALNFELNLHYVYMWTIVMYMPGAVHMYTHMCNQRQKNLGLRQKAE